MISELSISQRICRWSRRTVLFVAIAACALLAAHPARLRAQEIGSSMAQQAAMALTGNQQSLANRALCSVLGSKVPNPAAATPSMLSSSGVISAAAALFASSAKLPLPSATNMLQSYVAQHASGILASCAVSNATSGIAAKIPEASGMPSIPKIP